MPIFLLYLNRSNQETFGIHIYVYLYVVCVMCIVKGFSKYTLGNGNSE